MNDITPLVRGFITSTDYRYKMSIELNNKLLLERIQQTDFSKYLSTADVIKKGTPIGIRKLWFVKKCFEKFGLDSFDFSTMVFINTKEQIELECREHGKFQILPNNFLNNAKGCPKCGYKYREGKQ